jgi:hypothetical protein
MWCWWCCHPFDSTPLNLPYRYDDMRSKFYTCGYFCSWSCMKKYAIDKYGITKGGIISGNIIMMRKKMYNKIGSVRLAPNRERLAVFGGDLSIEEFRSDNLVDTEIPNPIQTDDFEDRVVPVTSSNVVKMEEIKSADGKNETLRLKREKPLKRNQNNLESALGLIIKTKP